MKTNSRIFLGLLAATLFAQASASATDIVWIGGTGLWNAAANWSPSVVPAAGDNAFITNNGSYTVTVPDAVNPTVGTVSLGGAIGTQTLSLGRSILTLNGASQVNSNGQIVLTVGNSTITGAGDLTVNGTLDWASGTMIGTGITTIGAGGELVINGGVTLTGRALNNGGHVLWSSGNFTAGSGAVINNLAAGVFDLAFDGRLSVATAPAIFNNAGLFRKTAGAATATFNPPFNNSGMIQTVAGTLSLDGGSDHSGTISNALGATLNFGGGNHSLAAGSLVTGAGAVSVSGNATTLNANGIFDVTGSRLNVTAGSATIAPGCDVTGTILTIGGGVLNFNNSGAVGTLTLTGGTLGGFGPVNVTGLLTLGGGTITNAFVIANGGININGNTTLNGGKLINPTNAIWSAGNLTGANGSVFNNLLGATFNNTFDGNLSAGAGATPTFVNAGLFQKTGGTAPQGKTSIDFQFINTGTVEVQTNTLRYAINQQTAGLTLLDGGDLAAQAQPIQFLGGTFMGTGVVTVANTQNLTNSATINPGLPLGDLDIAGNYKQTPSGILNIELGGYSAGADFDLLTVTGGGAGGVATLGGTLNITLTNGFSPTNGATFTFLIAVSRVGAFATFNYPSNDIGMQISYDLTSAKVIVSNLKPVVANPFNNPASVTYGATFDFQFPANTFTDPDNNALTYSASGMPPGITFDAASRTFSGTSIQAGVFPVAIAATDNGSPSLTVTNTFTITINPAPLMVIASAQGKTYGASLALGTTAFTTIGLMNSDSMTGVTLSSAGAANTAGVGGYGLTATGAVGSGLANYTISYVAGTLTVNAKALIVTANSTSKTYGQVVTLAGTEFTTGEGQLVNGDSVTSATLSSAGAAASAQVTGISYSITPSAAAGTGLSNYSIGYENGSLTVNPKALTITAQSRSKAYGTTVVFDETTPSPDFTVSGLVNSDSVISVVLSSPGSAATAPVTGNSYAITPSAAAGTGLGNYTIGYAPGNLTVNPALLTITAGNTNKVYGTTVTLTGAEFTSAGLMNAETLGSVTLTASGTPAGSAATAAAGSYIITPSAATGGTFNPINYTITYASGALTVSKADLVVTADAKTKTYGAADPAFTASYLGFVNGETPTALGGTLAPSRAPGEDVGSYLITPGGLTSGDYAITYSTGTLTITKALLSVTADAKSKIYAATDPILTYAVGGLKFSDTPTTVLSGTLTRAAGETVAGSPYALTQGSLAVNGNYTMSFTGNTLTITKAALSVTADARTKTYGAIDPAFTVTYSGFVNSETLAVLGGTLATSRAPGENVGNYLITPSGLTSGNYAIAFNTGALQITKATLSVAVDALTKTYGAVDPALTFTVGGLQFSDTPNAVLTGVPTRVVGDTVAGSPYTITQGTLTPNGNYTISFAENSLTIARAPLSVTAEAKSKTYGAVDPAFTATYAEFVNNETPAVLGGTLAFSRAPGEGVGNYLIAPSGLTSANYSITFNTGTFTITAPAPTILSLIGANTANVVITWSSVSNGTYRTQFKTDLNTSNWTDLAGDVTASGSTASKTEVRTGTNRFYRVQVVP